MASVASYDDLVNRVGGNFTLNEPFWGETQATTGLMSSNYASYVNLATMRTFPSFPAGVTSYIPTTISGQFSSGTTGFPVFVCQAVNLGTLDISGPTFTDGSAMPTETELGVSSATYGPVFYEITTALNATPGSIQVTYIDQDGNAAEAGPTYALPTTNGNIHTMGTLGLNGSDIGVRDITTATRTGGTTPTGVIKFWGIRPIAMMCSDGNGVLYTENLITSCFNFCCLPAGAQVLYITTSGGTTTTARALSGSMFVIGDS